ncbi:MAG: fibronectin type III domain-containing protein [Bacteriovoracaceae bacterium]|jgi:hypothetical protein|nr:fibronectin type III domain-containing protein [Bacteriovoracaceae bacterium]
MKINSFLFFILINLLFASCEMSSLNDSGAGYHPINNGRFSSSLKFKGIQSIDAVTDTTVNIYWEHVEGAKEYIIYDVSSGVPTFVATVYAPAEDFRVDRLDSGVEYKFMVRVKDEVGLIDANELSLSATTLAKPEAPTLINRAIPDKLNDAIREPSFVVFGANPGDTVTLYTDAACTAQVAQVETKYSFLSIKVENLTLDTNYKFYATRTNIHGDQSDCSTAFGEYNLLTCPDGYIYVPESPVIAGNPFCIMKYEAKAWADIDNDNLVDASEVDNDGCGEASCVTKNWASAFNLSPGSTAYGQPWRMITAEAAKTACQSLGENYDLVSNDEWMRLAENIEKQNMNWSSGSVGSGCLFRGNNGVSSICSYDAGVIDAGIGRNPLAMYEVSDGMSSEFIWDVAGNVAEWVDWAADDSITGSPYNCHNSWQELSSSFCEGRFETTDFLPFNPANIPWSSYNNSKGLGLLEGASGGILTRGGAFLYEERAGVFNISFNQSQNTARSDIGFRCVYRIPYR